MIVGDNIKLDVNVRSQDQKTIDGALGLMVEAGSRMTQHTDMRPKTEDSFNFYGRTLMITFGKMYLT